jgi:cytochrome c556
MKRFIGKGSTALLCAAGVALFGIAGAFAADSAPTPDDQAKAAVDVRQSIFKLQGWNMDVLGGMLKNRIPFDAAQVKLAGDRLTALSSMIPDAFKPDTSKFNVETEALPLIWNYKDDFDKKAADLTAAAEALSMTAAGGDKGMTFRAVANVGKACGACHDKFRKQQ